MWNLIELILWVAFGLHILRYLAYILLWFKDFLKEIFVENQNNIKSAEENTFN